MTLELPWPPSVNHYYRHVGSKVLISAKGREYRRQVILWIAAHSVRWTKFAGGERLAVRVDAYPPDRRKRDLGNLDKSLMDSLQSAGVFADDEQIDDLRFVRMPPVPGGRVAVTIEAIP